MGEQPNSAELVKRVKDKNRRLMQATVVFMALSGIALIIIVFVGLNNLSRANEQLAAQEQLLHQQNETLKAISGAADQRTQQLSKISNQIDCIAQFFTQRNRTNVVITDLEQCKILNPDGTITGGTGFSSPQSTNTAIPEENLPANNPEQQQPETPQQPAEPTEPEPAEVLGIPVCIPLTNVCVRR